ncbi:MAG: hypothetical protein U0Y68_10970 [Blastocatellia bacterium]
MNTETSNEELVRYLLGALPEAEQDQLEDRAFADRALLRRLEDAENDLIDDYVRGALTAKERQQFEQRFLASATRQKKVEFARALARIPAPTAVAAQSTPSPRWWETMAAFFRGAQPRWQFSLAAMALLLCGIVWLFSVTRGLRTQLAQLQAQQQVQKEQAETTRQQAERERARNETLAADLARERAHNEELAQQLAQNRASAAPSILSLFLPPGVGRGNDQAKKLTLPSTAQTVQLQIGLERSDDYASYRVQISTLQGAPIWTRARLQPRGLALSLTLPSRLLRDGPYEITLQGVTNTQQTEDVRFYYFNVVKK